MKNVLYFVITLFFSMILFSCEKNIPEKSEEENEKDVPKEDEGENEKEEDFYYVKYQISGKIYFYIDEVTYNTENGSESEEFSAARSFEFVCGPVDKGFVAKVSLTEHRGEPANNATKILVSKNNGPFAVKVSGQYSATYTIDY